MSNATISVNGAARFKGNKEKITAAVLAIYDNYGALTPERLIAAAKPKNSPLHKEFTWDADRALAEVQRSQALYLIRNITLEIREVGTEHVYRGREFVVNPHKTDEYISVRTALSDSEMRAQAVAALVERLEDMQEELRQFKEFTRVVMAIDTVKRRVVTKKAA